MANWYVTLGGTELGPIGDAQLRNLAGTGKLAPEDLVRKDGMAQGVQAGNVKGLFPAVPTPPPIVAPPADPTLPPILVTSSEGPTAPATLNADSFPYWYRGRPGQWPKPLQIVAWIFYGFIWIPAWWGWSLTKRQDRTSQEKGKKVLGAVTIGALVLIAFAMSDSSGQPSGSSRFGGIFTAAPTKKLTEDDFRQQIAGAVFVPKTKFYDRYGKPTQVTTIGDATYLIYPCNDAVVRVACPTGPFQYEDMIAPYAVDQMY